jgi:hypothetical protein
MFVLFLTGAGRVMGLHAAQLGHVATVGLHGSASTWVFNVARELMIDSFGEKAVLWSCHFTQMRLRKYRTTPYCARDTS